MSIREKEKRSREIAMEIVYQSTINDKDPVELVADYFEEYGELEEADRDYVMRVVGGVMEKREELDALIEANLVKWKLSRVSKINLSILRVALYEIKHEDSIPNNVSINEAVEISKKYSDEQSAAFINGILDKIVKA
ncbi:transcription antitermination factor NusB [Youngiibacter fragilis]|uniref:Transcription antitermination protein NusB n=1 Tax=Youngiibacter fragilis 232.1 TaxID=994573 RepID=V7I004_9CLOT|nr:transcription antitermination factor NusB [Youngiibacter fragilis]ETA79203.1 transcription antitermination protein NusB [Youngiibacter fragilis 232.1]